ncbi:hypothetical protein AAEU32_11020 [Pseudoalteromonas sp. SSDWG2]|uniref:hypothetical protein n=1 Tax=Pseudoalteromonas sp. SSDWG2 TaxID=3139391 RepID=UPI003BA938D4
MLMLLCLLVGTLGGWVLTLFAYRQGNEHPSNILGAGLIIAALIYVFFALLYANTTWLVIEFAGVGVCSLLFWLAKRYSIYFLAIGWLLHPVWDVGLHLIVQDGQFAPLWYVYLCISFDVVVALGMVKALCKDTDKHSYQND